MKKIILLISLIISFNKISFSANLDSGLVAYYPFNGNANDESGNGHNGTLINNPSLTNDRFGNTNKAYSFNGVGQYISLPSSINITDNLSISFWMRTSVSDPDPWPSGMFIIDRDICFFRRDWSVTMGLGGKLMFSTGTFNGDLVLLSTTDINTNEWKHCVIIRDAINQQKKIFINGVLNDSAGFDSQPFENNFINIYLGASVCDPNNHDFYNGALDDIRIYNRSLTDSEIQLLHNDIGENLTLKVIPQGFYNSIANKLRMKDTVQVFIREANLPYNISYSSKGVIDSVTFQKNLSIFVSPGSYYIVVKHRNCIETWSSSTVSFSGGTINYDFTLSASQAYGNNLIKVENSPLRFGIYSGDVDQDRIVDLTDLTLIENDARDFTSGYVPTDLTGDNFVDLPDLIIADNNAFNFVKIIRP